MVRNLTQSEKTLLLGMLAEAMKTLREDPGEFKGDRVFGDLIYRRNRCQHEICEIFTFENQSIPESNIWMETRDDPLDLSEDRLKVAAVPYEFVARFVSPVTGVSIDEIKQTLQVEDYWIGGGGEKNVFPKNGIQLSPTGTVISFRYRAKETSRSRFPVDVVVTYLGPSRDESPGTEPWIDSIYLTRAYPYLTPEMRKKKREEAQHK
ncbi:hypothetical protein [Burkholderia sp. Ax-1719]|uniref:hypothetical protein n=1 Tax=Burkholderia sp. Ax-1719 TaxID=2608334 RepID=UPI001423AF32|nr:hypothetical protein [Burkholderia sp. Ax-1719]NIE66300.1 hypothetical protein [Burkholderia sp. Ax-1719]